MFQVYERNPLQYDHETHTACSFSRVRFPLDFPHFLRGFLLLLRLGFLLVLVFRLAQNRAILSGRHFGVKWFSKDGDVVLTVYEDANGNGVLTADIKAGIDRLVAGPYWMRGKHPHITFSFLKNFKGLDPSGSPIGNLADPIRFGRSDICSFAPDGGASPGSVYLSNGVDRQAVVRVSPASGKIQVFDWLPGKRKWVRRL